MWIVKNKKGSYFVYNYAKRGVNIPWNASMYWSPSKYMATKFTNEENADHAMTIFQGYAGKVEYTKERA